MPNEQKIKVGFVCLEETKEEGIKRVKKELERLGLLSEDFDLDIEFSPEPKYLKCCADLIVDSLCLVENKKVEKVEPLWVQRQENKRLWRK